MKQLLWIGCLEDDVEFQDKVKKGANLGSAHVSQKNILDGIEEVSGLTFDSINGSVLPPFPKYSEKYIEEKKWSHKGDTFDISVGYKNIKYLNRLYCKYSMIDVAKRWVKDRYKGKELDVFVYSMRSAPMATACYIKKRIPNAKIYLIITDLPKFMDLGQNSIKKILKKIDWLFIKKYQRQFDGFILYAEKMADFLHIPKEKWILMEGSYNVEEQSLNNISLNKDINAIMYSGNLDIQYGIDKLLNAFMKIPDENVELWLTGGGNAEKYIKKCCEKDERIKFFGFLPSRKDVLNLQRKATCLINMRLPSEIASSYCFPSKLPLSSLLLIVRLILHYNLFLCIYILVLFYIPYSLYFLILLLPNEYNLITLLSLNFVLFLLHKMYIQQFHYFYLIYFLGIHQYVVKSLNTIPPVVIKIRLYYIIKNKFFVDFRQILLHYFPL